MIRYLKEVVIDPLQKYVEEDSSKLETQFY